MAKRMRLVVGVDGSKPSRRALEWASRVAAATGGEVVAVTVCVPPQAETPPKHLRELRRAAAEDLARWVDPVVSPLGIAPKQKVLDGDPRYALADAAERFGPCTLVVGALGAGGARPGPLRLGSVAEYLAHHAPGPVAVIAPSGPLPVRRILLGVDGSPHSLAAAAWCAPVAAALEAEVVAATVHEPLLEWTRADSPRNWRREVEARIRDEWTGPLGAAGQPVKALAIRRASPVDGLLQAAADSRSDLLVVGTRGAGGFLGLRVGGTAMKLLHRTDSSIVLVPLPEV